MLLRPLPLPADVTGRLWLSAMPARTEPWSVFVQAATKAALTRIVCLTPMGEVAARSPEYLLAIEQGRTPAPVQLMAMADFGVSDDAATFRRTVLDLAEALRQGESLLLHCAWGIGRTGTVAACVLKALGLPTALALERVRAAGSNPQSALQSGWVSSFGALP